MLAQPLAATAALAVVLAATPAAVASAETSVVHAAIALSSARLRVDETLTITGYVINTGRRSLRLPSRPPLHAMSYLRLVDPSGHRLPGRALVRLDPDPPRATDFALIGPGQTLAIDIAARLVRAESGFSLVLGRRHDSAIDVPRGGRYLVVFEYESPRALAEQAMRTFGLQDIWDGIAAASVVLTIE